MSSIAVGIYCKTPSAGASKTRLSPPLSHEQCAVLSACFIRDLASTVQSLTSDGSVVAYAIYTPLGTEDVLRALLPPSFRLLPQCKGDLETRLLQTSADLLGAGHAGFILVNADSPTLPARILRAAVDAVRARDAVVLSRAIDGGYTLIGLSRRHSRIFADIPWSTPDVYRVTLERAAEIGLPVVDVPCWYDVDDADGLALLEAELAGAHPPFAQPDLLGAPAPATRRFLLQRSADPHGTSVI